LYKKSFLICQRAVKSAYSLKIMDKTITKHDELPEDENNENDSNNQQSDESIEMVNHSDISDPSNDNPEVPNNESTTASNEVVNDKKEAEAVPGDPMHSIKQLLEGSNENNHINNLNESTEPNKSSPIVEALNQLQGISEPLKPARPIHPDSSTTSMDTISEAESLKRAETDTQSTSSDSFDNEGNRKDRRRTYHVRHNTVTITSPENIIAKEVASVLNELADSPPDSLMNILQQRLTEYAIEKENEWKGESERSFAKAKAIHEMRHAFERNNAALAATSNTPRPSSRPASPIIDFERLIRERDQSHEHASATMRSLREIIRQQELLMDKEQSHSEHIHHIQQEMESTNSTINQLHLRYNALLADAEEELLQADVAVNRIRRELDDSMVTLRFKVRQQEMTIRSHETTVENLQAEKKELLDICEDLVAHTEAKHPQPQPPLPPPEMDDIGGF
jgi:hypothetical protein